MFAAVPIVEVRKQILEEIPEAMDEWGYVHGYLVGSHILALGWWIPIIQETLLTKQEFSEAEEAWTEEMYVDLEAAQVEEEEGDWWDDYNDTYPCGCCMCCGCTCDWEYDLLDKDWEEE